MKLTAINRWMLFPKILKSYNKKNGCHITMACCFTLISVAHLAKGRRTTMKEIQEHLKLNRHFYGSNIINGHLNNMLALELISKDGHYPARYSLTLYGRNTLNYLENKLRKARIDR
jgi:hypothetical protein